MADVEARVPSSELLALFFRSMSDVSPSSQVTTFDIAEFHAMTSDPVWMAKYAKANLAFLEDMDE